MLETHYPACSCRRNTSSGTPPRSRFSKCLVGASKLVCDDAVPRILLPPSVVLVCGLQGGVEWILPRAFPASCSSAGGIAALEPEALVGLVQCSTVPMRPPKNCAL